MNHEIYNQVSGRRSMLPLLLLLIVFLPFQAMPTHAQTDDALIGPVVAVTPAEMDAIILYDLHDLSVDEVPSRRLDFPPGELHVWDFSPDGCRVLFTLDQSENGLPTLYSAKLDGSDMQAMVTYDELDADAWGVWEPDWSGRNRIAFTMYRDQNDARETHIAWINGEGGEPDFFSVTGREFSPQWSPDGEWLAYVSYDERIAGADVQSTAVPTTEPPPGEAAPTLPTVLEADMWVVSADAAIKYPLTDFSVGSVRHPRWSPDGELVGFIYSPSPANDMFYMIANQRDAIPTQLSYFWNLTLDHTWLPDSSAMLAAVRDFQGLSENLLWVIPLIGNADTDATRYLLDDTLDYADYPRFSADGRYLAFRSAYSLVVINTQTSEYRRLAPLSNTPPVWTPEAFVGEAVCD